MADQQVNHDVDDAAWQITAVPVLREVVQAPDIRGAEDAIDEDNGTPSLLNGRIFGDLINLVGVLVTAAATAQIVSSGDRLRVMFEIGLGGFAGLMALGTLFLWVSPRVLSSVRRMLDEGRLDRQKLTVYRWCITGQLIIIALAGIAMAAAAGVQVLTLKLATDIALSAAALLVLGQVLGQLFCIGRAAKKAHVARKKRAKARAERRPPPPVGFRRKLLAVVAAIVLALGLTGILTGLIWSMAASFAAGLAPAGGSTGAADLATVVGAGGWITVELAILAGFALNWGQKRTRFNKTERPEPHWAEALVTILRAIVLFAGLLPLILVALKGYVYSDTRDVVTWIVGSCAFGIVLGIGLGIHNIWEKTRAGDAARDAARDAGRQEPVAAPQPRAPVAAINAAGRQANRFGDRVAAHALRRANQAANGAGVAGRIRAVLGALRRRAGRGPAPAAVPMNDLAGYRTAVNSARSDDEEDG